MMTRKEIDSLVAGLVDEVGSSDVYDIIDHLKIVFIRDNENQNPILKYCNGMYVRSVFDEEVIIIKDNLANEKQVIAHELGHALMHTEYNSLAHNKFALPGRNEFEANYFATRLLYRDVDIKKYSEYTKKEISMELGISEDWIDYLVNKA